MIPRSRTPLASAQRLARQRRLAARRVYAIANAGCCLSLAITGDAADDARNEVPSAAIPDDANSSAPSSGTRSSGSDEAPRPVILLAEDEPAVRRLLVRYLEDVDYVVLPAANGLEALEIAASYPHPINLVITDVSMPQMNGRMLADRVNELRPGVPVIFMSGYTGDVSLDHELRELGQLFVAKPFSLSALEALVRQQLERKRPGA